VRRPRSGCAPLAALVERRERALEPAELALEDAGRLRRVVARLLHADPRGGIRLPVDQRPEGELGRVPQPRGRDRDAVDPDRVALQRVQRLAAARAAPS
jgi:hypothetical protein